MRVIIAEKPDMARKIASALQGPHKSSQGYIETGEGIVTYAIGHLAQSFEPHEYNPAWKAWNMAQLPMLIDDWKIKIDPAKSKQFNIIKGLLSKCTECVNAGDPGREGQLIVDEILHYLKFNKPVKRVLLYSLDKKSVRDAFANLQDNKNFHALYEAGVCRGYADWLMGMNATRAYTLMAQKRGYQGVLSVGRVQSPTLAIVVKRDEEIENFKPHDYASLTATFEHESKKFDAYWRASESTPESAVDEEGRLIDLNLAQNIAQKILNKSAVVKSYEEKEGKENQPMPFNLSKMQIYANSKWGMSAKEVLDVCQSLYEKHELQTYPRTDCQYLPENQFGDAANILRHIAAGQPDLQKACSEANTSIKSGAWNDSKLGEHFGLIPTKKQADMSQLSPNEKKIYRAVCERYIAQFYPPCEYSSAAVVLDCEKETFKATGKVILKPGWKAVFSGDVEAEEKADNGEKEQVFPKLSQGQNVLCCDCKKQDKKTTPPPRFTEGSLIRAMTNVHTLVTDPEQKKKLKEKKGIGQEATRVQILENLFKRGLLLKTGKQIISSGAARALIKALPKKVTDPALTAIWEDALDRIAQGKLDPVVFRQKQDQWVVTLVDEAKKSTMENIPASQSKPAPKKKVVAKSSKPGSTAKLSAGDKCPSCGKGVMRQRTSKAGDKKFLGCSNFPECKHVQWES